MTVWIAMSNFENSYNADFLYHLLRSTTIQKYWQQSVPLGTIRNLNAEIVRLTLIPLPSREEQARIVAILDRFDALCNDLTQGLPAEIEARRKQYEYYRDRLLTFEEATS
ncbi:MAG UNVERIFIED_CONTAM: restriction endonuclease subunit S [Anaerolineae bacterium]